MKELLTHIKKAFDALPLKVHKHFLPPEPHSMQERYRWLLAAGLVICPEYRFTGPNLSWWRNPEFTAYLEKFGELYGRNSHRRWQLHQLMKRIKKLEGDTVECGVYEGASSWLMLHNTRTHNRMHHIFDSFEGLSAPLPVDGAHWSKADLSADEATLHENLSEFKGRYAAYKGWIPERFHEVADRQFAFVHIDVDLYEPTRDSLEFFYPRLVPGGVMLCDDYGFTNNPGANKAVDDFMQNKEEELFVLPCGGCYLQKEVVS